MTIGETVRIENEAAQLHGGDVDAIVPLIQRYQQPLYGFLLRMVRQPDIAEDLLQKTWLRAIERIHSYDPNRSFKAWLFAVARNVAIDHLRRRQPLSLNSHLTDSSETVFIEQLHEPGPNALELLAVREHLDLVRKTMAELPANLYEVFKLRFMEEMKLVEIAEFLVLPLNTVKTRLYRALKKFHQIFRRKAEWNYDGLIIYS
jgi:RNA polymerase sigma-70 factor (ECF subfamily)